MALMWSLGRSAGKIMLPGAVLALSGWLLSAYMIFSTSDFSLHVAWVQRMHQIESIQSTGAPETKRPFQIERNSEFPYPLTCSTKQHQKPKEFTVAVTYHVGRVNNWKTILHDQMNTLNQCGLGSLVDKFILSYSNGELKDLLAELRNYSFAAKPDVVAHSLGLPWEGAAMNATREFCAAARRRTAVFYFHNKGVSRYAPNWREQGASYDHSYSHSLYWRKYMEFFLLERPETCLYHIIKGNASTCGTMLKREPTTHYSGNFWAASCDHLKRLPLVGDNSCYYDGEFWVSPPPEREASINLDDVTARLRSPKKMPYFDLLVPELYWNHTENLLTAEMEEVFGRNSNIVAPIPAPVSSQDEENREVSTQDKVEGEKSAAKGSSFTFEPSAAQLALLPDHCSEPKRGELVIRGERHSGGDFMERILRKNTWKGLNQVFLNSKYGGKHDFLPPLGGKGQPFDTSRDTLVIVTRDAFAWLSKMMDEADPKNKGDFSAFIRGPYSNIYCHGDIRSAANSNPLQIRTEKYKQWLSDEPDPATHTGSREAFLRGRVHVRLESLATDSPVSAKRSQVEYVRDPLVNACVLMLPGTSFRVANIDPIEVGKETLKRYSKEDLRFVLSQLDLEFERRLGYDYGYVYDILNE